MARLRYLSNARTGAAGTVCNGDMAITGDLNVDGSITYDTIDVPLNQNLQGTLTIGQNDTGYDVKFYGDSSGSYWLWDEDADGVVLVGSTSHTGILTMITTSKLHFHDSGGGEYIYASADNALELFGGTSITLTSTTINIAGAITSTGKMTFTPVTTGTFLDFELQNWGYGTLINADFGGGEVLDGATIGMELDFYSGGNVTATSGQDLTGYKVLFPLLSVSANTSFTGFDLYSAGAIVATGNTFTWKGLNIAMPQTTSSSGTVNAYGVFVTSGTLTSGTQIGVYVAGTLTDGFKMHAAAVDGIELSGDCTNFINFSNAADTSAIALHFVNAFLGKIIETGTYGTNTGVTLASGNYRPVSFLFDDGGSELTAQNYRGVLSRIYLSQDQTNQVSIRAMQGHIKLADDIDLTIGQNYFGAVNGVEGYIETTGTGAITVGANARVAAVHGYVELRQNTTVTSGGILAGLFAELGMNSTYSITNKSAGVWVDILDSDHGWTGKWTYGVHIAGSSSTTGINIEACSTANIAISGANATGIAMTGTYSANAIKITHSTATSGLVDVELASTFTANSGSHFGIKSNMTITAGTGTTFTGDAGQFRSVLDGDITGTCWVSGLHSELEFTSLARYGSSAGIYVALNAIISADSSAVFTSGHIAVLRLATNAGKVLTGTSGICTFIYIDNDLQHSVGGMDSVMCLHSWDTPYLFDIPAGGQSGGIQDTTASSAGTPIGHLKIRFNGSEAFINVFGAVT